MSWYIPEKGEPLSPLQQQIHWLLVSTPLSAKGIAKELNRAIGTIYTNLDIIYKRLGVTSRVELVIKHYQGELKKCA